MIVPVCSLKPVSFHFYTPEPASAGGAVHLILRNKIILQSPNIYPKGPDRILVVKIYAAILTKQSEKYDEMSKVTKEPFSDPHLTAGTETWFLHQRLSFALTPLKAAAHVSNYKAVAPFICVCLSCW